MKRKFIILNNGLRDHRGHYFETSISIAEAARRAGLHPILATHVDCRAELLPKWLEVYPIFCTDHWVTEPPAEPPDLSDLHLDPYADPRPSIDEARGRRITIRQFLTHRFQAVKAKGAEGAAAASEKIGRLGTAYQRLGWICRKACWSLDRLGFYLLPPVLDSTCRLIWRQCVPRIVRDGNLPRIRARTAQVARRLTGAAAIASDAAVGPETTRNLGLPFERPAIIQALDELRPLGLDREIENAMIFKRDLERLLALAGAGPDDFVLLGTAHAREILAVQLVSARLGQARAPWFHLEFRHPLFQTDPTDAEHKASANIRMQQTFLSLYESRGASESIKFFTDTQELSKDYGFISNVPFGVLPIPFRAELIAPPSGTADRPLRLAYLGEPRDEKGFPWLGRLIDDLMEDYVRNGRVDFILQANMSAPQYNPHSARAMDVLKAYPREHVQLVGLDAPLSPEEYYALVSAADAVLLPYDRDRYRACSSGTLAEAIAGGRPVVVPADSWLSAQLPAGAGLTFHNYDSFLASTKRLVQDYARHQACAESSREAWLANHTPDHLIAVLLESMKTQENSRFAA